MKEKLRKCCFQRKKKNKKNLDLFLENLKNALDGDPSELSPSSLPFNGGGNADFGVNGVDGVDVNGVGVGVDGVGVDDVNGNGNGVDVGGVDVGVDVGVEDFEDDFSFGFGAKVLLDGRRSTREPFADGCSSSFLVFA